MEEIFDFSKHPAEPNWDVYNRHMDSIIRESTRKLAQQMRQQAIDFIQKKKEATMQVTYNGFTGELVKLERKATQILSYQTDGEMKAKTFFMEPDFYLTIYNESKREIRAFSGVKLADVKFLGGTATMSGTLNIGEVAFGG